jgi:hypothetical protein
MTTSGGDEFYVGYLKAVPRGYARVVRWSVLGVGAVLLGVAMGAAVQRDPGPATWDAAPGEATGVLILRPYPILIQAEGTARRAVPLVGEGKCGVGVDGCCCPPPLSAERFAALGGQAVVVRGTPLTRGSHRAIEVAAIDAAPDGSSNPTIASPVASGAQQAQVTLIGEVIDPKCYLGAMKPGEGKSHRACAVRCISGGVPPALLIREPGEPERIILLTDAAGGPATLIPGFIDHVADTVEVRGRLSRIEDLEVLAIDDLRRR